MNTDRETIPQLKVIGRSLVDCFLAFYGWARRVGMLSARPRAATPYVREMANSAWHLYILVNTRIEVAKPPAEANHASIGDVPAIREWMVRTANVLAEGAEAVGENDAVCVKLAQQFRDEARKLEGLELSVDREKAVSAAVAAGLLNEKIVEESEPDAFGD